MLTQQDGTPSWCGLWKHSSQLISCGGFPDSAWLENTFPNFSAVQSGHKGESLGKDAALVLYLEVTASNSRHPSAFFPGLLVAKWHLLVATTNLPAEVHELNAASSSGKWTGFANRAWRSSTMRGCFSQSVLKMEGKTREGHELLKKRRGRTLPEGFQGGKRINTRMLHLNSVGVNRSSLWATEVAKRNSLKTAIINSPKKKSITPICPLWCHKARDWLKKLIVFVFFAGEPPCLCAW